MSDYNTEDAFNDAAGIVDETIIGPYLFQGRVRVLGFAAEREKLEVFLKTYLQDQLDKSGFEFELASKEKKQVVYMLINDFDELTGVRKKGIYRNRSCQFHIPVTCVKADGPAERGSLQVFSYGSNMQNVLTSTEVRGPFMSHSGMHMKAWIEDLDIQAPAQVLFEVSPQVLGPDKKVVNECLLSLEKTIDEGETVNSAVQPEWDLVLQDISTIFAFKQFQHEKWRGRACYQSLVKITHKLVKKPDKPEDKTAVPVKLEPVDKTAALVTQHWRSTSDSEKLGLLCARIFKYEYHPIVKALGLVTESSGCKILTEADTAGSGVEKTTCVEFDLLRPLSYLVIDSEKAEPPVSFYEPLGETLCYRSNMQGEKNGWQPVPKPSENSETNS